MKNITLFDNFNARYSSYEEVAKTFIPNEGFVNVTKNNHTFVLGPRGCGKTTMFKMLTTPALKSWNPRNPEEEIIKRNINFLAIYIPSDDLWKDQLSNLLSYVSNSEHKTEFLTNALIKINVLINFCKSVKNHLLYIDVENKTKKEFEFCEKLIDAWGLNESSSTILSIMFSIEKLKLRLIEKTKKDYLNYKKDNNFIEYDSDFYHSEFLDSIKLGLMAYENVYNDGKEIKWALCFDELELISKKFFHKILNTLRISPSNILFKLSASPLSDFQTEYAQVFHDYQVVKMWPSSPSEDIDYSLFCEKIAKENLVAYFSCQNLCCEDIDFNKIFGNQDYKNILIKEYKFDVDALAKEGEMGSITWYAFRELAKYDSNLRRELIKRKIDPENPIPNCQSDSDTFFRKTKEIVINKLFFNNYRSNNVTRSSKKEYPIYHGKEVIFKICEGNPRFVMNIINEILTKLDPSTNIQTISFSPLEQAKVIKNVSVRFNAMLNTFPTSVPLENREIDLEWMIKTIGNYFDNEVNIRPFNINPANCFIFKKLAINKALKQIITKGVGLGAFMKIDNNPDEISNSRKTRYRLSYLLHPTFKLPLRLFSSVKLEKILKIRGFNETNISDSEQEKLF